MRIIISVLLSMCSMCSVAASGNYYGGMPMDPEAFAGMYPELTEPGEIFTEKRSVASGGIPPITYQVEGQASAYEAEELRCTYGGHPSREDISNILPNDQGSVDQALSDGYLVAILHCFNGDKIVRIKPVYQRIVLKYTTAAKKQEGFSFTASTWPTPNSSNADGHMLDMAYVIVKQEGDGYSRRLIHNGHEALLSQYPDPAFKAYPKMQDMCQSQSEIFMVIFGQQRYFPGNTGDSFLSMLEEILFSNPSDYGGDKKKDAPPVRVETCLEGLYNLLVPDFFDNG
ncbi:MAG: hypothetical protein IPJ67_01390 [Candidatus Moraniibacteriota bacterium]|nr:MAG: hypothetical protein IPJ67_01390 [Candidatus Moranbacteria bacterium]